MAQNALVYKPYGFDIAKEVAQSEGATLRGAAKQYLEKQQARETAEAAPETPKQAKAS